MTLKEIAQHVCDVTGLTDNLSVDQARSFVKRRWQMLWDFHLWRQSLVTVEIDVVKDVDTYALPEAFDQVTGAKLAGESEEALLPVGDDFGAPLYKHLLRPRYFQQMPKVSGILCVKLIPKPDKEYLMPVSGKRKCVMLEADGDEPSISGSANALIAYAMGDMLELMRQFGKAQTKFAEGAAHQNKMVEIEKNQSANIPVLQPLQMNTGHSFNNEFYEGGF
jgi:uncharacterized protein YggU (UPF0235/DUF167 family)